MYRINEIFYSLQGEGRHTGRAAVFIRMSGCNMRCPFCDTDFQSYREMSAEDIVAAIQPWKSCGFIVLTGGEPTLQVDAPLVQALKAEGFYLAMETNGTGFVADGVDWVTYSPKDSFVEYAPKRLVQHVNEVKVIFDGVHDPSPYASIDALHYLQPCDTGDEVRNQEIVAQCVAYIKQHPQWQLSLQTQKLIKIP